MSIPQVHAILAQAQQVGDDIVAELQQAAGVPIEGGADERSLQERLDALDLLLAKAKDAANRDEASRLVEQAKGMIAAERLEFERVLSKARGAYNEARDAHGEDSPEAAQAAEVEENMRQQLAGFDTYQKLTEAAYDEALALIIPVPNIAESLGENRLQIVAEKLAALKREFEIEFEKIKNMASASSGVSSDEDRQQKAAALLEKMREDLA